MHAHENTSPIITEKCMTSLCLLTFCEFFFGNLDMRKLEILSIWPGFKLFVSIVRTYLCRKAFKNSNKWKLQTMLSILPTFLSESLDEFPFLFLMFIFVPGLYLTSLVKAWLQPHNSSYYLNYQDKLV